MKIAILNAVSKRINVSAELGISFLEHSFFNVS